MSALSIQLSEGFLNDLAERIAQTLVGSESTVGRDRYLTAREAAEYLHFPLKRIYNLASRGEVPYRKQDGRLLFRRDELDAWLDQFYVGPDWAGPGALGDL